MGKSNRAALTPEDLDPQLVSDLLTLASVTVPDDITREWTGEEMVLAATWAGKAHMRAGDHPVRVPEMPWLVGVAAELEGMRALIATVPHAHRDKAVRKGAANPYGCAWCELMPGAAVHQAPQRAIEAYPPEVRACPSCDSPYGAVHGPDCPLDLGNSPWLAALAARAVQGATS